MKTIITIVSLSTNLVCLAASAQAQPPASGGGNGERFKQFDRNGDGKITRNEMQQSPLFDQWDANKDGIVTMEEVQSFYSGRQTRQPAVKRPITEPSRLATKPLTAVSSLAKPSLEVCLSAGSTEEATKFFAEGLGLPARGEPRSAAGVAMQMLLFNAGDSTVKVRVYARQRCSVERCLVPDPSCGWSLWLGASLRSGCRTYRTWRTTLCADHLCFAIPGRERPSPLLRRLRWWRPRHGNEAP